MAERIKYKIIKPYGLLVPGDVIETYPAHGDQIVAAGKAERFIAVRNDPDCDGKDEGGAQGIKKAFSQPPQQLTRKKK